MQPTGTPALQGREDVSRTAAAKRLGVGKSTLHRELAAIEKGDSHE